MTFLPSASVLFQVPKINVFFDMFVLGFGSSCRKIGANPGLMSVWRLSRGTNCPGPECGAKSQAQTKLVCLPEQGRHGGMQRPQIDSRRHIIHTTTNELLQHHSFPLQPAWQNKRPHGIEQTPPNTQIPENDTCGTSNLENWRKTLPHCTMPWKRARKA